MMADSIQERITKNDVEIYKREVLERSMLVAPPEAARILACSERTVYDLVRGGYLHGFNRNKGTRGLRILARELQDYVQSIKIDKDKWLE
jgi:hypothetical protein